MQNNSTNTKDCKRDFEFEIKTKKGLCTLPPSTHRDDKNSRYQAVGIADCILENDLLYDLFIILFQDGIIQKDEKEIYKGGLKESTTSISFYDLSKDAIDNSVSTLAQFYIEHYRNNFVLCFSGLSFYNKISKDSASKIITKICSLKEDKDLKESLNTLTQTYINVSSGKPITGGPTLAELISKLNECTLDDAQKIIDNIKGLWQKDIRTNSAVNTSYNNASKYDGDTSGIDSGQITGNSLTNDHDNSLSLNIISVSNAKMLNDGHVKVRGKIMKATSSFKMIHTTSYNCSNPECSNKNNVVVHPRPLQSVYEREPGKERCIVCEKPTVSAKYNYINTVEIDLHDVDNVNEIDRLVTYLFEDNIKSIKIGEAVIIDGNIDVINKNDNKRNRKIAALYGNSIHYESSKEIQITPQDIEEITSLKNETGDQWIDALLHN